MGFEHFCCVSRKKYELVLFFLRGHEWRDCDVVFSLERSGSELGGLECWKMSCFYWVKAHAFLGPRCTNLRVKSCRVSARANEKRYPVRWCDQFFSPKKCWMFFFCKMGVAVCSLAPTLIRKYEVSEGVAILDRTGQTIRIKCICRYTIQMCKYDVFCHKIFLGAL